MSRATSPLACAALLAFSAPAASAGSQIAVGERIEWDVRYYAVRAGTAWAEVLAGEGGSLVLKGGARNADWYARFYTLDDLVESHWDPAGPGSTLYLTRFREGSFHQDQRMDIDPGGISVARKQRFDEGWRDWVDEYDGPGEPVEDPQSAFYRLRGLPLVPGASYRFPVFSGRLTWQMRVRVGQPQQLQTALGSVQVLPLQLFTQHQGDLEQRGAMELFVTHDSRRVPVRAIMHSNVGPIRAELTSYTPGTE